jgi:anti-sigma factor RsiW
VNCAETSELLNAYLDGELDLVRALGVEKHLATCATCSQSYESLRSLKTALKASPHYYNAPTGLQGQIRTSIFGEERKPAATPFAWAKFLRLAIPLAGAALIAFFLIPIFTRPSAESRLAQEITASHVRSLMTDHRTDVASSDQHTVKPWFEGKLDFAPTVVDLGQQGFPLVGGRLDFVEGRLAAALVYQRRKHSINLFIWPASTQSSRSERMTVQKGYNLIHWRESGMNYWAISDLNSAELKEFVQLFKKTL